jgi:RHS repeat-associated protein
MLIALLSLTSANSTITKRWDERAGNDSLWTAPKRPYRSRMAASGSRPARRELLTSITDAAGATRLFSYKSGTDLLNQDNWSPFTTTLGYDSTGQLTLEVNTGSTTNFGYNGNGELTLAGTQSYNYDANGNQSGASTTIGADNELLGDGIWNYSYDIGGNTTGKTQVSGSLTWSYGYDAANEMTLAVETSGGATLANVSYGYDAFGNRIAETVTQGTTTTTTDSSFLAVNPPQVGADATNWPLYADLNSSGTVQTRYLGGTQPNQWFARIDSTGVHWLLTDNLGSVRAVTNSSGGVIDSIAYDAYGNITSDSNASVGGRIKYAGYVADAVTGTDQSGPRPYMPSAQRWMTQDPSGLGPDSNPYRYVGNDPMTATDPSGLSPWPGGEITVHYQIVIPFGDKGNKKVAATSVVTPIGFEMTKPKINLIRDNGALVVYNFLAWTKFSLLAPELASSTRTITVNGKKITQRLYSQDFYSQATTFKFVATKGQETEFQKEFNKNPGLDALNLILPAKGWIAKVGKQIAKDKVKDFFSGKLPTFLQAEVISGEWSPAYSISVWKEDPNGKPLGEGKTAPLGFVSAGSSGKRFPFSSRKQLETILEEQKLPFVGYDLRPYTE